MTIHEFLTERGYKGPTKDQFKPYTVYFYRRIPETGHQWLVYEYTIDIPNRARYISYTVGMIYEDYDGNWIDSKFYGLSEEELRTKLESMEQRLYLAVVPMGGNKEDYRGKKEE